MVLFGISFICGARPVSARECQIVRQFVAKSFGEPSPSARQHILTKIAKLFFSPDQSTLLTSIDQIEKDEETAANGESDGELGFSCRVFALMLISLIHSTQLRFICPFEWKALIASLDGQFEQCQAKNYFTGFRENTKKDLLFANPHSPRSIGSAISFAFSSPASVRQFLAAGLLEYDIELVDLHCPEGVTKHSGTSRFRHVVDDVCHNSFCLLLMVGMSKDNGKTICTSEFTSCPERTAVAASNRIR
uniref:Uncharacterized protein n=1 Tax=Globodera pallida TaxID=36090 RepID=A0A183BVL8_GLOPA